MIFSRWSLLEDLHRAQILEYIDLYLALHFYEEKKFSSSVASLFTYLYASCRRGFMRVRFDLGRLVPDPLQWRRKEEEIPLLKRWIREIIQGREELPSHWVTNISYRRNGQQATTPLISFQEALYFHAFWMREVKALSHLSRIFQGGHPIQPSKRGLSVKEEERLATLLPEQRRVLWSIYNCGVTLLSGGPGTGKTYVVGSCLRLLESERYKRERAWRIALCAPTGKAVFQLQQSVQNQISSPSPLHVEAQTVHRLLLRKKGPHLQADFFFVDECSLLDSYWIEQLLSAIPNGAHLILSGDSFQLPSVGVGALFNDFFSYSPLQREVPSPLFLHHSLRVEKNDLLPLFLSIRQGKVSQALHQIEKSSSIHFLNLQKGGEEEGQRKEWLLSLLASHLPSPQKLATMSFSQAFSLCTQFCFLSPIRQGVWGEESLNRELLMHFLSSISEPMQILIPISITQNDSRLELFNGEMGFWRLLYHPHRPLQEQREGHFLLTLRNEQQLYANLDKQVREIPSALFANYAYTYGFSVHKSQGSEFDHVFFLLPETSRFTSRELLYTAITRAKSELTLCATPTTLKSTIEISCQR